MAQVDNHIKYDVSVSKTYFCWWLFGRYLVLYLQMCISCSRSFDVVLLEVLFYFGQLAGNYVAVGIFITVLVKVVLVVILGHPKFMQRQQTSSYLHSLLLLQTLDHFLGDFLLKLIFVKDSWEVASANVIALAICLSRIVTHKKYLKNLWIV